MIASKEGETSIYVAKSRVFPLVEESADITMNRGTTTRRIKKLTHTLPYYSYALSLLMWAYSYAKPSALIDISRSPNTGKPRSSKASASSVTLPVSGP